MHELGQIVCRLLGRAEEVLPPQDNEVVYPLSNAQDVMMPTPSQYLVREPPKGSDKGAMNEHRPIGEAPVLPMTCPHN